jgi:hypothetical protein
VAISLEMGIIARFGGISLKLADRETRSFSSLITQISLIYFVKKRHKSKGLSKNFVAGKAKD